MLAARLHIDLALPPAHALARGRAVLDEASADRPLVAYGASLSAASVVLGAYQHAPHALRAEPLAALALPVLRRSSGGVALWASPGVLYLALALRDASTLMACPPGRTLNRNVRGLLAGLRGLGIPAFYFGRDFVSVGAGPAPAACIGWDEAADGRVLLECFVAHQTSFELPSGLDGYPTRTAPVFGGKPITTLQAAGARALEAEAVLSAIAMGYARAFGVEFEREPLSPAVLERAERLQPALRVEPGAHQGLVWSRPHEEAIGFISAGVSLDARGQLSAVELGGDFFQRHDCAAALRARLVGTGGEPVIVGAAIDAVYAGRPGLLEGVRSLTSLRDAMLDAIDKARTRT